MEPAPQNTRLVKRAYWLIKLRWIAIAGVSLATFFARNILDVSVQDVPLYCIAAALILYNIISLLLLKRTLRANAANIFASIKKIINFQISADLLALTVLLHYSGGIENPFVIYFIFHMVIASILLSVWESYLQATFAVVLLGLLALLEYAGIIPHYCLEGFVPHDLYRDGFYLIGTVSVFATALYLVVYMTSSISTQLRKQEEAYRQANIQLKQKDRIKDEYVLRVTHDIKGHLAAIQSCLDVVVNKLVGPLSERQSDLIDRAHNRTKKLTAFVRALLRLTQMRLSDQFEMDFFSLRQTISNALATVETKAKDKAIDLTDAIEPSVDRIYGNQVSIEEMITNLLLNAIKYTPQNGAVTLSAKEQNDFILVDIADTGIGIPEDELGRVFDEFFRASNARKVERDGTGLGLSMAKQTIQRHGGNIWVDSQETVGTKLSFTLPKTNSPKDIRVHNFSSEIS